MTFKTSLIAITFGPTESHQEPPLSGGFLHTNQVLAGQCTHYNRHRHPIVACDFYHNQRMLMMLFGEFWYFRHICLQLQWESPRITWSLMINRPPHPTSSRLYLQPMPIHMSCGLLIFSFFYGLLWLFLVVNDISGTTNCNYNSTHKYPCWITTFWGSLLQSRYWASHCKCGYRHLPSRWFVVIIS